MKTPRPSIVFLYKNQIIYDYEYHFILITEELNSALMVLLTSLCGENGVTLYYFQ
jgi:hypothetical protein